MLVLLGDSWGKKRVLIPRAVVENCWVSRKVGSRPGQARTRHSSWVQRRLPRQPLIGPHATYLTHLWRARHAELKGAPMLIGWRSQLRSPWILPVSRSIVRLPEVKSAFLQQMNT